MAACPGAQRQSLHSAMEKAAPTSVFSAAAISAATAPPTRGRDPTPAGGDESRASVATRTRSRSRECGGDGADEGMAAGGGAWGAAAADDGAEGAMDAEGADVPEFRALSAQEQARAAGRTAGGRADYRRVRVPAHRYTPLRQQWEALMAPVVEHLKLLIRFNPRARAVELKTGPATKDTGALQKGADYVTAFALGFELQDAVALLRLDDLYVDSFEVKDVKLLRGDHISRAIGRVAGQNGKMKLAIENATRTRLVIANERIHVLGSVANIKVARDAVCDLIMGAPIGKVYNKMRSVAKRVNERF